jgi:hypothetical protein
MRAFASQRQANPYANSWNDEIYALKLVSVLKMNAGNGSTKKAPSKQNVPVKTGTRLSTNESVSKSKILSRETFTFRKDFFSAVFSTTSPRANSGLAEEW